MADQTPFAPTIFDMAFPRQEGQIAPPMGADIQPKMPIGYQGNLMAASPFLLPLAAMVNMRLKMRQNAAPEMAAPANQNAGMPRLDVPNAVPRGGNTANSHVGQLNQLSPQQFQVYMNARGRGLSAADALAAAKGE